MSVPRALFTLLAALIVVRRVRPGPDYLFGFQLSPFLSKCMDKLANPQLLAY